MVSGLQSEYNGHKQGPVRPTGASRSLLDFVLALLISRLLGHLFTRIAGTLAIS